MTIHRFGLALMFSCSIFTFACNNPIFNPSFKVPDDTVYSDIRKIVKTEDIYIEGHKTPIDDIVNKSLTVQLINAENTTLSKDSLIDIQKKVARKVKSRLKDPLQYEEYYIIFIKRDTTKVLTSTKTSEEGLLQHTFRATDL